MSGNTEHTGSGSSSIPVMLLVHRKAAKLIEQTYENLLILNSDEGTAPQFFQSEMVKHEKFEGIFGFLSEHDYLADKHAIERVVKTLQHTYIGGAYGDGYISAHTAIPQILPTFDKAYYTKVVINCPIFVLSTILQNWNVELESAYFFDYYCKLGAATMLAHIPHPLIVSNQHKTSTDEIERVRKTHG